MRSPHTGKGEGEGGLADTGGKRAAWRAALLPVLLLLFLLLMMEG